MLTARTYDEMHEHALAAPAGPRVLVFRTCRMPQFEGTVAWIREQWPAATIDAVTSPGFDVPLKAAGIARAFHYTGRSLRLLRHAWLIRRLRDERFDVVVIAQANGLAVHHTNLYRVAAAIGARRFVVAAPDRDPETYEPRAFGWLTLGASLGRVLDLCDVPLLLVALVAAWVRPRRRLTAATGRRRVLHVITSLGVGGAQVQLAELLGRTPADRYEVHVLVIGRQDGDFSRRWLTRDDITFHYAEGWPRRLLAAIDVARVCRAHHFDLVHTWLFVGNVIGAAGAGLAGVPRIIGSVRNLSLWKRTWYAEWWFRVADILATRVADVVTVNATPLAADHAAWAWYPARRIAVVPNGLDPARLLPHADGARAGLRAELRLPPATPIVGTVGRLAPEKDHVTFLRAVAHAIGAVPDLHAVIAGDGALRQTLDAEVTALGLDGRVHLLGERADSRRIIAALDVFVLTSRIEGFPNVLLEAAFLGVPAIATRVGGAPDLVDDEDLVEPGDVEATARGVVAALAHPAAAAARAAAARTRAHTEFTSDRSTARWLALYDTLLPQKGDDQ